VAQPLFLLGVAPALLKGQKMEKRPPFVENPLFAQRPDIDLQLIQWAKQVKLKDGYRCTEEKCEENNLEMLDAHHIEPISVSPQKQYLLQNGQTLCLWHHARKHKGIAQILILIRLLNVLVKRL